MRWRDPYDPSEAFDDVVGRSRAVRDRGAARRALREILRAAQRARRLPRSVRVEPAAHDGGRFEVLGAHAARALLVRVETPGDHAAFRDLRRAPYLAEMVDAADRLEAAREEYDRVGGGGIAGHSDAAVLESIGAEVEVAAGLARAGGEPVFASFPPWMSGKVECWRDGDEVLVAVRLPGPRGDVRVATAGAPLRQCVGEAVGLAAEAGVDPGAAAAIAPVIAPALGAGRLVGCVCCAAPLLLARPEVVRGEPFAAVVTWEDAR